MNIIKKRPKERVVSSYFYVKLLAVISMNLLAKGFSWRRFSLLNKKIRDVCLWNLTSTQENCTFQRAILSYLLIYFALSLVSRSVSPQLLCGVALKASMLSVAFEFS